MQRHPINLNIFAQYISSGALYGGDNRSVASRQSVQKAGFPGIWQTNDSYINAITKQMTLVGLF